MPCLLQHSHAFLCRLLIFLLVFIPIVTWSGADTKSFPQREEKPFMATRCIECHSSSTDNAANSIHPKLDGQHAHYLLKQLDDFKNPSRRHHPIMSSIAQPLTKDDCIRLSLYFSQLPPPESAARDAKQAEKGKQLWRMGEPSVSIASCFGCHGPNGEGIPPVFPRLSGQSASYTVIQLQAFRNQTRTNDANQMMRLLTKRLTDEEIHAVAEFAEGLR